MSKKKWEPLDLGFMCSCGRGGSNAERAAHFAKHRRDEDRAVSFMFAAFAVFLVVSFVLIVGPAL